MTTAKRLIFRSDRKVEIESFEIPVPGPHEVLVRVSHSQVSAGSEMNFFRHNPIEGPLVKAQLGYMTVGEVIAVGSAIADYQPGERVLTSGFHQSHWIVDLDPASDATPAKRYIQKLDAAIKSEQAGFVILGDVSLHGLRRVQPQIDESAAVIGCGIVGQFAIQLARIAGMYPIIAIDLVDARLEKAKLSGATHIVNSAQVDPVAAVMEITEGAGAECVFPCAPVPSTIQPAMEMAAKRGKVSLIASIPGTAEIGLQVELMRRELSIIGTYEVDIDEPSAYWPWSRSRNRRACLRLLKSGDLNLDHLISHVVPYTAAESMFATMHDGHTDWMGVVFTWPDL